MSKERKLLVSLIVLTLFSSPVYSQSYENTSILKLGFQLIFYLIIFIAVIFMAVYGAKLVAENAKGISSSKYIELLDAINIPGGSKIVIAKVNHMIYILSASNGGLDIIDKFEEKDFPIMEEEFATYLDKCLDRNKLSNSNLNRSLQSLLKKFIRKKDKEDKEDEK